MLATPPDEYVFDFGEIVEVVQIRFSAFCGVSRKPTADPRG
jgi:hypothetical protein